MSSAGLPPMPPPASRTSATRWSLVAALRGGSPEEARSSLLELCLHAWYPVYAFLRHCGHGPEPAQSLAREFFDGVLRSTEVGADASRFPRFRDYLVAQLHLFLARASGHPSASAPLPPASTERLEARLRSDGEAATPEDALRRGFAHGIIGDALARLRGEAREAGRLTLYGALEPYLAAEPPAGEMERIAAAQSVRPLFLVAALRRLRQRFRELVDEQLGDTVLDENQVDAERQALLAAMDRGAKE